MQIACADGHDARACCRNMSHNALSGGLPANWGWDNVLTMLEVLTLDDNSLSGPLPAGFGSAGALKSLLVLNLDNNRLTGKHGLLLGRGLCIAAMPCLCMDVTRR